MDPDRVPRGVGGRAHWKARMWLHENPTSEVSTPSES